MKANLEVITTGPGGPVRYIGLAGLTNERQDSEKDQLHRMAGDARRVAAAASGPALRGTVLLAHRGAAGGMDAVLPGSDAAMPPQTGLLHARRSQLQLVADGAMHARLRGSRQPVSGPAAERRRDGRWAAGVRKAAGRALLR